jgi:hypothetical protein
LVSVFSITAFPMNFMELLIRIRITPDQFFMRIGITLVPNKKAP